MPSIIQCWESGLQKALLSPGVIKNWTWRANEGMIFLERTFRRSKAFKMLTYVILSWACRRRLRLLRYPQIDITQGTTSFTTCLALILSCVSPAWNRPYTRAKLALSTTTMTTFEPSKLGTKEQWVDKLFNEHMIHWHSSIFQAGTMYMKTNSKTSRK